MEVRGEREVGCFDGTLELESMDKVGTDTRLTAVSGAGKSLLARCHHLKHFPCPFKPYFLVCNITKNAISISDLLDRSTFWIVVLRYRDNLIDAR